MLSQSFRLEHLLDKESVILETTKIPSRANDNDF